LREISWSKKHYPASNLKTIQLFLIKKHQTLWIIINSTSPIQASQTHKLINLINYNLCIPELNYFSDWFLIVFIEFFIWLIGVQNKDSNTSYCLNRLAIGGSLNWDFHKSLNKTWLVSYFRSRRLISEKSNKKYFH
jgi:hypothetical protein